MEEKDFLFEDCMDENEEDQEAREVDFSEAVVWGTDWTTETIAMQIAKGNIDLNPTFQRRDAWSNKEKSKLIESLMLGIPVPPIVLAEDPNSKNHYIVIDGKQRLLSIMQFYADSNPIKSYLGEKQYEVLSLSGLEVLKELNKKKYSSIPEKKISDIDNAVIRTIAIKNWPNEDFLYTVFLRLNTGSKKLSPQELRQALKPGPFLSFLDEVSAESKQVRKMLGINTPDKRMRDVELALRFFAFKLYIQEYRGNLKYFLDSTCEKLNSSWTNEEINIRKMYDDFEEAIDFAFLLFPDHPFSRFKLGTSTNSFNRCIFELFTFYFSDKNIRDMVLSNKEDFIIKFLELNDKQEFVQSILGYPKMTEKVVTRFNLFAQLLKDVDKDQTLESIKEFRYIGAGIEEK